MKNNILAAVLMLLALFTADLAAQMPEIPGLKYDGCFQLTDKSTDRNLLTKVAWNWGCGYVKDGYYFAGNRTNQYNAGFLIPSELSQNLPVYNPLSKVSTLNAPKVERSTDWTPSVPLDKVDDFIPATSIEVSSFFLLNNKLGTSVNRFYNVGNFKWPFLWIDGVGYSSSIDPIYTGGYVFEFPIEHRKYTGRFGCGNNRTGNGIQQPVLWTFDNIQDNMTITHKLGNKVHLYECIDATGAVTLKDKVPDLSTIPPTIEKDGYTVCCQNQITGACALGDNIYFIGLKGTGFGWYGNPQFTYNGKSYNDKRMATKGYHNEFYEYAVYIYNTEDIVKVKYGILQPEAVQPKSVVSLKTAVPEVATTKSGIYADQINNKVYVTVPYMLASGVTYPIVFVFSGI